MFSRAPFISIAYLDVRRFLGTSILSVSFKYCAVNEFDAKMSLNVPVATTCPPRVPASGPISIISSASFMMSSSCSTTITVFPKSRNAFKTNINLSVSLGCKPILGSSRIYIEPTRLLPSDVARFIRWLSPPDKVLDFLFSVK